MAGAADSIPVVAHNIGQQELAAATAALGRQALTAGPECNAFEAELAAWFGVEDVLVVNSCTAAMHLALLAADIGVGSEVITTPVTFPATVNVILAVGATPVFADVLEDGLSLDPRSVACAVTRQTRAIVPVHMGGMASDMPELQRIAREHGLRLIADAAHAVDTRVGGAHIATMGDAAAFSFYATKNMTTLEGGALVGDHDIVERARLLSRHGLRFDWGTPGASVARSYEPVAPGFKYNMTEVAAAIGRVQLSRLPGLQQIRREAAAAYDLALADNPSVDRAARKVASEHSWYLYQIRVAPPLRDDFIAHMRRAGIATSSYYKPLHHFDLYRSAARVPLPVADAHLSTAVALPMHSRLDSGRIERIASALRAAPRAS